MLSQLANPEMVRVRGQNSDWRRISFPTRRTFIQVKNECDDNKRETKVKEKEILHVVKIKTLDSDFQPKQFFDKDKELFTIESLRMDDKRS